ncbi:MAG: DUF2272 domain-containing protein [Rhodospirillales bacterium]|nr:DUF2272 domain-containing protein [Rhodospirillales bacterium]MDE2577028.1 DUF2272 domain-containing protein [Rhodospirillales bacterium]
MRRRTAGRRAAPACLLGVLLLAACQAPPDLAARVPPFTRLPYAPFARADAVAIALREWRLWGAPVDDAPPDETAPPPAPESKPERQAGLWQRVGEYWWIGQNPDQPEAAWTGKHDADGHVFPASQDEDFAWSAAFISYVMRIAGAGPHFPYAPAHATYIDVARAVSLGTAAGGAQGWWVSAAAPDAVAPRPGDLICVGRHAAARLRFADLPVARFPAHCDIVVAAEPGQLTVIGGNVDDAVTEKHVPTTPDGRLAPPGGDPLDTRYPWMVVIQVAYQQ